MIDRSALADAFAQWVVAPRRDDMISVPAHRDANGIHVDVLPAATVAYELSDFSQPLPDSVGVALRLPASATFAHAARLLWCMRDDETFACHSYDAALRTLQSLPPDTFQRYYDVVDEAVDAVTTTLPVWPGAESTTAA